MESIKYLPSWDSVIAALNQEVEAVKKGLVLGANKNVTINIFPKSVKIFSISEGKV